MNVNAIGWPADAVERRPVETLIPYARNARTHSAEQIEQIAASIRAYGFTMPVLIDEAGGIIAGHGRVMAAKLIGLAEVPTMTARGWSEAQRAAYVLADNQIALNAGWDADVLRAEIEALKAFDFDLGLTGFDDSAIAGILATGDRGLTDPDDVPPVPAVPAARAGDVWLLGGHRLICGDATDAATVAAVLAGAATHLMVTDPPYGVDYNPTWRDDCGGEFGDGKTKMRGKVTNDDRVDWSEAWALFQGDVAYVWHASLKAAEVAVTLTETGFIPRAQIIWVKQHFTLMRTGYHWQHEPCWYAVRGGQRGQWSGDRKQTTVWEIQSLNPAGGNKTEAKTGHGTQKPVECMRRPIENNSKPGDAVYDPFLGSGTTIIAAEMTGRRCCAIELSPAYVDVSVERWQAFVGKDATLEGDDRTFAEIKKSRARPPRRDRARKAA